MKNSALVFVIITVCFVGILAGVLIGRSFVPSVAGQVQSPEYSAKTTGLDLNTATKSQLCLLPGVGEVLADRIILYREQNGPFSCIEDLMLVEGIGITKFNELKDYITVGGSV